MKITNNYKLPEPLYRVLSSSYPPKEGRLSVTALTAGPMVYHLKLQHWAELEEDASGRLWALMGQMPHVILEKNTDKNAFAEEKLEMPFNGTVIVGVSDNFKDNIITDWKVTSVWSGIKGCKPEWTAQLNIYAWLWRKHGFSVEALRVYAILRDWQRNRVGDNYPPIPFKEFNVPLWTIERQEAYITERVKLFSEIPPPECTDEEKWKALPVYAVMKKGRKSALRLLDSEEAAKQWIEANGHKDSSAISIQFRPGEAKKCKDYCPVAKFCPYNEYREDNQ